MSNKFSEAFATCEFCGRPIYEDDNYVADIEDACYFCSECAADAALYEQQMLDEVCQR